MIGWSADGLVFAKCLAKWVGNGFSVLPNFGLYGGLGVWESSENAERFFETNMRRLKFLASTTGIYGWEASLTFTLFLKN